MAAAAAAPITPGRTGAVGAGSSGGEGGASHPAISGSADVMGQLSEAFKRLSSQTASAEGKVCVCWVGGACTCTVWVGVRRGLTVARAGWTAQRRCRCHCCCCCSS
jgi:6-phosphogluconate dehydrogenase